MDEYQVPKNLKNGVLDTRGMPLDPRRELPIPDMMHQVKSTLNGYKGKELVVIVQKEQEAINLADIAKYRGYAIAQTQAEII